MWFAALGTYQHNPWFLRLEEGLLRNKPAVTALLERNPFPNEPPRYLRATLYDYHFTTVPEQRATGAWWKREERGEYHADHIASILGKLIACSGVSAKRLGTDVTDGLGSSGEIEANSLSASQKRHYNRLRVARRFHANIRRPAGPWLQRHSVCRFES